MSREGILAASQLGALGLDPLRFIETTDPLERVLMSELAKGIWEQKKILDHNLAVEIANAVGKLFKA